jgi:hypothetical protein
VVHADDDRAARPVALDQIEVPERLGRVERGRHQVADELLERALVVGSGEGEVMDVEVGVEVLVLGPVGRPPRPRLDDALGEAGKAVDHPLHEQLAQRHRVERLLEPGHAVDDHQIRRPVHGEPGRIGGRHGVLTVILLLPRRAPPTSRAAGARGVPDAEYSLRGCPQGVGVASWSTRAVGLAA